MSLELEIPFFLSRAVFATTHVRVFAMALFYRQRRPHWSTYGACAVAAVVLLFMDVLLVFGWFIAIIFGGGWEAVASMIGTFTAVAALVWSISALRSSFNDGKLLPQDG